MGTKRNILSVHRKIAKDAAKTIQANSPGGRYHTPTVGEKVAAAGRRTTRRRFTE